MNPLRNYISDRKNEIKAQIQALRKEMVELNVAEAAIGSAVHTNDVQVRRRNGRRTIKDMVIEILKDGSQLEAVKIVEELNNKFGEKIERSSLSPQLSRLKSENHIQLIDSKWSLAQPNPLTQFQDLDDLDNPFENEERVPF